MQAVTGKNPARTAVLFTLAAVVSALYLALPERAPQQIALDGAGVKQQIVYTFSPGIPSDAARAADAAAAAAAAAATEEQASRLKSTTETLEGVFKLDSERATQFATWIHEAEAATGVPPELMAALIATESSFRYNARSWVGAVGPTQVRPRFWQEFCGGDLQDPRTNVICGAKVLAHYRESCPDWSCALKKYNVGPTAYRQASFVPAMERYIAKIRFHLGQLGETGASRYRWVASR
jgi:soluble lytic murein transglycosylase-like protein